MEKVSHEWARWVTGTVADLAFGIPALRLLAYRCQRCARGEIDKEEFESKKRDLR